MSIRTWLLETFFRRELDERIRLAIPALAERWDAAAGLFETEVELGAG